MEVTIHPWKRHLKQPQKGKISEEPGGVFFKHPAIHDSMTSKNPIQCIRGTFMLLSFRCIPKKPLLWKKKRTQKK